MTGSLEASQAGRVDWVDYAKGFCIIMVVMMHSTLGVEQAAGQEGWMHYAVAFAKPFRMPDFFLISGLFLARVIDRDWRDYLDRKVVHFAYFYVLWVTIQFGFKAPGIASAMGWKAVGLAYLEAYIEPFGTLWFIYLLPIFFVVVKLLRNTSPLPIFFFAAMLEIAQVNTGWTMIDEFAHRFVYFYAGYALAAYVFDFAAGVQARPVGALMGLALWAFINGAMVFGGYADMRVISLALGFIGAGAVVAVSALFAMSSSVRVPALLRQELHRHLSRLLPLHGRDPNRAAQDRHHPGPRHRVVDRDRRGRHRRTVLVLGRAQHAVQVPVRPPRPLPAQGQEAGRGDAAGGVIPLSFRGATKWRARNPDPGTEYSAGFRARAFRRAPE